MKTNILVVMPVTPEHKKWLEACAPDAVFEYCPADRVTKEQVETAEIIVGNVSPALLACADAINPQRQPDHMYLGRKQNHQEQHTAASW